jgi:hypothetical protein
VQLELMRRLPGMSDGDLAKTAKTLVDLAGRVMPSVRYSETRTTTSSETWKTAGAVLTGSSGVIDLDPVGAQPDALDDDDDE